MSTASQPNGLSKAVQDALMAQDLALAKAMKELTDQPSALANWVASQKENTINAIKKQKNDTIDKVYGDFDRSSKVVDAILMHNKRTQELANIMNNVYDSQQVSATSVVHDKDLATRKNEMNEWSVGNKKDTLFVFSSLFIVLSGLLLITGLWRLGMISTVLWVAIGTPLVLIFLLIFVRRWRYTEVLRNKRYWNKQIFEGKSEKISVPSCEQLVRGASQLGSAAAGVAGAAGVAAGGTA